MDCTSVYFSTLMIIWCYRRGRITSECALPSENVQGMCATQDIIELSDSLRTIHCNCSALIRLYFSASRLFVVFFRSTKPLLRYKSARFKTGKNGVVLIMHQVTFLKILSSFSKCQLRATDRLNASEFPDNSSGICEKHVSTMCEIWVPFYAPRNKAENKG